MSFTLPLSGGIGDHGGTGILDGRLTKGKLGKSRLQGICQVLCIGQVILGLVATFAASSYLYSYLQTSGQIIGVFLVVVGLLGLVGSVLGHKTLLTSHMVTITLAMMLTFDFNAQVTRDTFVDCSLAELFQRNYMIQEVLEANQRSELMTQIFIRLTEMEDLISMSHEASVAAMQIKQEQEGIKTTDIEYIREKLQMMKDHAQASIDDLVNNPNITREWVSGLSEQEKEILNKRVDAAENVLHKVEALEDPNHKITIEEYQQLLKDLTDSFQIQLYVDSGPKDSSMLVTALNEMEVAKGAYQRLQEDKYHEIEVPSEASKLLQNRQQQMEQRRKKWQERFVQEWQKTKKQHDEAGDALADLPEHCMMEQTKIFLGLSNCQYSFLANKW
eukprot:TRINITY_DN6706_c0_g1_i2.p1 TRINITY_DN6706_c0_g1~~TRINITY_DN6706_c0_g1_i2.p1  ORF type:complete len:433 (+),score=48.52 TRINITY_DN6706_c0_g1_i2:138-1301(+)